MASPKAGELMRRFAWLGAAAGILAAGCSSTLREVRAREPEFRFAGIAASMQLEVARCIRDVLDRGVGEGILQELELARDGVHVVGRPDESLSAAVFYDVAVREEAVVAMLAPRSVIPRDMLRSAIAACVAAPGAGGKQ
jgi:hypothetical protein